MDAARSYDRVASEYVTHRRPDARIARAIGHALGDVRTVVNVGAGAGSYEPCDLDVIAVEPSHEMALRHGGTVVQGVAEHLPLRDGAVDAALAVLTVHHWSDFSAGLREMVRVARQRIVILTWDPSHPGFWFTRDYLPQILEIDRKLFPALDEIGRHLRVLQIADLPIPGDCADGFLGAYWRRPGAYLASDVRRAISTFSRIGDVAPALARLRSDLASDAWQRSHGTLLAREELDLGYRLVIARGLG